MLLFKYYGYIIFILFYLFFIKKLEKIKLNEVGLNKDIKKIFKGIILGIISLSIIILILMLFNQIKFNGINKDVNYLMIILFLGGYLIQASMEEIICRGFILNKIKNKTNIYLAIIISFLFFSVGHFGELFNDGVVIGFIGVINLFLVSLIWSNLSIKDNNIYSAIGFHFIWNFTLFNIIGLNLSGVDANYSLLKFTSNNSFLSGMSYGIESSIITTLILILTILLVECVKRTKK